MARAAAGLLLVLSGLLAVLTAAQAQAVTSLVTNEPATTRSGSSDYRAQSFQTGTNAAGYTLSEIDIRLRTVSGRSMVVAVRNDNNGVPGSLLATLMNPTTLRALTVNTFMAPNDTMLEAGTTYWISLHEGIESDSQGAGYETTSADNQWGKAGWRIGNDSLSRSIETADWTTSSSSLVFTMKGTVINPSAALKHLELREPDGSGVDLTPGLYWSANNTGTVRQSTGVATIVATPRDEAATVEYRRSDGMVIGDADTGKAGHQVALWSYANPVEIKVTSAGGFNEKTYKLTVRRLGSPTQQAATGQPVIVGTPRVGETLTVDASGVTDANGTYFAETRSVLNFFRNGFAFFWHIESDNPNTILIIGTGRSVTLEKKVEGRRIFVQMSFRDDLNHLERPRSGSTQPVAGEPLVISGGSRTITGSRCDYVYPAGPGCDGESSARNVGDPLIVRTRGGVNVTSQVTFSVAARSRRTIADEFGKVHEASYEFAITSGGQLRTVAGKTYPGLESALCTRAIYSDPCAVGSISTWALDPVRVEVTARMNDGGYGTVQVPVYVLSHPDAVRVSGAGDLRCDGKQCYGRKLVPGQDLYAPTVQQQQQPRLPDTGASLTASFEDVPASHDGSTAFTFRLVFSEDVFTGTEQRVNKKVRKALEVTGGRATASRRVVKSSYDAYRIQVKPAGPETLTITLNPPSGECTASTAACTPDGRKLAYAISHRINGPPGISVADANVEEGPGAVLSFAVSLSRRIGRTITVDYATSDGTATAGTDYTATSGTLTFAPGENSATIEVPVIDDAHDEGDETLTLVLSNASGAYIADDKATGTIKNSDLMPQAWLARFGRTVAQQVLDAVEERIRSAPEAGVRMTVAGQAIGAAQAPDADAIEEAEARLESLSAWLAGETEARERRTGSRSVAPRELLTGSSFALTTGAEGIGGGLVSVWGRGAVSSFDGREGDLSLSGEVTGAMLGADWTRERWTTGLMLSHARGEGSYRGADSGQVSSTVTGLYPYGRYAVTDRVTVWGAAGYGAGTLTLTPEDREALKTDMDLMMAAAGLRGTVVEAPPEGGPELAVKTDAMAVRTSSEAVEDSAGGNLAAAEADVTRLRLGLEGTWRGLEIGTATLVPRLEIGVRHDGGDAETGFGLDLGGGLAWSDPGTGVRAEVSGRGLLTHESAGFRERGIAGSFGWDPTPGSDRGPSLTLSQTMGLSAQGGADALLGRTTLAGLAANDNGDELERRRLEVKLGYGFGAFGDRFTSTPEVGFGMSAGHRDYSLAWRFVRDRRRGDIGSLEFSLEARRRESVNDPGSGSGAGPEPEHGVGFRMTARW